MYSKPSVGAAAAVGTAAPAVLGGDTTWYILSAIVGLVLVGLVTIRVVGRRRRGRH